LAALFNLMFSSPSKRALSLSSSAHFHCSAACEILLYLLPVGFQRRLQCYYYFQCAGLDGQVKQHPFAERLSLLNELFCCFRGTTAAAYLSDTKIKSNRTELQLPLRACCRWKLWNYNNYFSCGSVKVK